jgi:hypothetical protein
MNHPAAQNYFVWYVKVCCLLVLARSSIWWKFNNARKQKEYARDARNISSINLFCLMDKSFIRFDMIFPKPERHATVCHGKISKQMICRVGDMQTSIESVGRSSSVLGRVFCNQQDRYE